MASSPGPAASDEQRARIRAFFEERIPFNRHLGLKLRALDEGHALLALPFREELIGDPLRPALHGGVLSALADTAGGAAVWSAAGSLECRVSTVDLRIDYLRPGQLRELHASARVLRLGNRVGVAAIHVFHPGDEDQPLAVVQAVYNLRRG